MVDNTQTMEENLASVKEQDPHGQQTGTDWKMEARKWEDRAKANSAKIRELNTRLSELDGSKNSLDKALERIADLEAQNKIYAREKLAVDVASELGVQAGLLKGETREELEAHARALLAWREDVKRPAAPSLGVQPENDSNISDTRRLLRELKQ